MRLILVAYIRGTDRRLGSVEIPEAGQFDFGGFTFEVCRAETDAAAEAALAGRAHGNGETGAPIPSDPEES